MSSNDSIKSLSGSALKRHAKQQSKKLEKKDRELKHKGDVLARTLGKLTQAERKEDIELAKALPKKYRLFQRIGEGSFGTVYKGSIASVQGPRECAIKISKKDKSQIAKEADVVARVKGRSLINSMFVVDIIDFF